VAPLAVCDHCRLPTVRLTTSAQGYGGQEAGHYD